MFCGYKVLGCFQPLLMHFVYASRYRFVRAHPIDAAHEDIAELSGKGGADQQIGIDMETGIALNSA